MDSHDITSSTVLYTICKLNKLGETTKRLTLNWIKAHHGHEGNEKADRLANMGARATSEHTHVPVSDKLVKNYIKTCLYDSWCVNWRKDTNLNKHTKMFFPEPNERLTKRLHKFNRAELTLIISAITGHNYLRYFSNKITVLGNTKCRLCNKETEIFYHLTNECTALAAQRLELFNNKKFMGTNTKWNPVSLLQFLNLDQVKQLFLPH